MFKKRCPRLGKGVEGISSGWKVSPFPARTAGMTFECKEEIRLQDSAVPSLDPWLLEFLLEACQTCATAEPQAIEALPFV